MKEITDFVQEHTTATVLGESYWNMLIQTYSSDYIKAITDSKYGAGSSDYIVKATSEIPILSAFLRLYLLVKLHNYYYI